MRAYLLATLERVAVVGAATATVLKEAMADMMMMCFGRCVRCGASRSNDTSTRCQFHLYSIQMKFKV
jgi:hypothetical protein